MRTVFLCAFCLLLIGCNPSPEYRTQSRSPNVDLSASAQNQRKEVIDLAKIGQVFYKIETQENIVRIYVGPPFYDLPIDQKNKLTWNALLYYHGENKKQDSGVLYDSRTGKRVGFVHLERGLRMN